MRIPIHRAISLILAASLGSAIACDTQGDDTRYEFRGEDHGTTTGDMHDTGTTGDKHDTGDTGDTGDLEGCVRTQGFWKNWNIFAVQPQRQIPWPIPETTMLCGQTWLQWLRTPSRGDAWIILVRQFIAASLNAAAGADVPADVADALVEAEGLLAGCTIAPEDREEALEIKDILGDFNEGNAGVESCD